ncbi:hypothetical protein ATE84_2368 [Aquimarina sp. MAR_2010_214]|uniref:hypothetical protein n=1 Tax=Aquimarina sp. MAR_2010_214 TaxID=1250026 RepID=UPI000C712B86|nr:hypothetical protein [Aquimarina sp. MAR_2010_214]PKV50312.1 hypothetical protein ATE84_2368 [Aquimarina sp. MAR_2010_214]
MKTLVLILFGMCFFPVSIQQNKAAVTELYNLEGVWELKHQFLYEDNQISDTILNQNGYRQVKMYSKEKVMWTRFDPKDNNEWFGYGTYTIKDGILEERLEYASGPMMKIVDTIQVFRFELTMDSNSYQQINIDKNGQYSLAENYNRVE